MGADLYIKKLRNKTDSPTVNHQNEPQAYFRDSYNLTSVLWTLGLSWWRDVLPLLDEELELNGQSLVFVRNRIANAEQRFPTLEELQRGRVQLDEEGGKSLEEFHRYYTEKRKQLVEFLDRAIHNHSAVICSL
jgi:hypothetical protein